MTNTRKQRSDKGKLRKTHGEHIPPLAAVDQAPDERAPESRVEEAQPVVESAPERGRAALSNHELTGLIQEAWEAYDVQDVKVRFDSLGFKWWFGVTAADGMTGLEIIRTSQVGGVTRTKISTSDLGRDCARQLVDNAVRALG